MRNSLHISRFAHVLRKNGQIAVFHALKMKPVFLSDALWQQVLDATSDLESHTTASANCLTEEVATALDALISNRVLHESPERDDEVITYFRDAIPKPSVKIAYFILAECCNMGCSYCFENAPKQQPASDTIMSLATAMTSLDFFETQLKRNTGPAPDANIIFYGGEPLINIDVLYALLDEIRERKASKPAIWSNVSLALVTNGTLMTDSVATKLSQYDIAVGISIDGPRSVTDANRCMKDKRSAFERILFGINACRRACIDFGLSVTLSPHALDAYREVVDFIKAVEPASLGFNILMSSGSSDLPDHDYAERAAEFLIEAFKEFREIGLYEDRMMRKVRAFSNSTVYPFDCGAAGGNQLVFSPSGQVGICHGYLQDKKYFASTVFDSGLDPSKESAFQAWIKRTPLNMDECQGCIALGICGGGCPLNAERTTGSLWGLDQRFCVHARLTIEWLIWELLEQAKAETPAN